MVIHFRAFLILVGEDSHFYKWRAYFVFGIIVGTLGFVVLNRTMDIYYFGFRGMFLTWATCVCIATFVVAPIVGQLLMWVIGIGLVIIAYKVIKNKGENTIEE